MSKSELFMTRLHANGFPLLVRHGYEKVLGDGFCDCAENRYTYTDVISETITPDVGKEFGLVADEAILIRRCVRVAAMEVLVKAFGALP